MKSEETIAGNGVLSGRRSVRGELSFATHSKRDYTEQRFQLPVPHPLDFDWRFSESALRLLLGYVRDFSGSDDTIALLGTPSVLRAALESGIKRHIVLLDANETVIRTFEALNHGERLMKCNLLMDHIPTLSAQIVIADPPWYEDYMRSFLWSASHLCQKGGTIVLTWPPFGTRPDLKVEWTRTLRWCKQVGITLRHFTGGAFSYVTPPFEQNALRAGGQCEVDRLWRKGDLAVFERTHNSSVERPRLHGLYERWSEQELEGVRWKVRKVASATFIDPALISILPGDVLPSVSRRDGRRNLVDVWTSGNRIFKCQGRDIFNTILCAAAQHISPVEAVSTSLQRKLTLEESRQVEYTLDQIEEIVNSERREYLLAWQG